VIVSTESEQIISVVKEYNTDVHVRDAHLAQAATPLDPVILDVVQNNSEFDYVITIQPTSPLLSISTLNSSIKKLIDE
jgi:CMP-N-acetylneuraminic acid synthetase